MGDWCGIIFSWLKSLRNNGEGAIESHPRGPQGQLVGTKISGSSQRGELSLVISSSRYIPHSPGECISAPLSPRVIS